MSKNSNTPDYIRHTFKVVNELKTYKVYELQKVENSLSLFPTIIRIEQYRGKSNSSYIEECLRLRNCSNWSKCTLVTGLRPTIIPGLFYGDWRKEIEVNKFKKTLLIFTFSKDLETLNIDVYRGFYPNHKGILNRIISTYKTY